jgi:hypothetical protein
MRQLIGFLRRRCCYQQKLTPFLHSGFAIDSSIKPINTLSGTNWLIDEQKTVTKCQLSTLGCGVHTRQP